MKSKEAVEIQAPFPAKAGGIRHRDGRSQTAIPRFFERDHHVQAIGCTALKHRDQHLRATGLAKQQMGRESKRHGRHTDTFQKMSTIHAASS